MQRGKSAPKVAERRRLYNLIQLITSGKDTGYVRVLEHKNKSGRAIKEKTALVVRRSAAKNRLVYPPDTIELNLT